MTLPKGPFRKVVYIEQRLGKRGGEYWALRLECEHVTHVPIPRLDMAGILFKRKPLVRYAPKRCRCMLCGLLES